MRRDRSAGALSIALAAATVIVLAQAPAADLLLINGRVYAVDRGRPRAEAIAIGGARIPAVGTTEEISRVRTRSQAAPIDLRGAVVSSRFNHGRSTSTPPARRCPARICSTCARSRSPGVSRRPPCGCPRAAGLRG